MGRIGRLLKTAIEKFIITTVETRLGLNQEGALFSSSGDDSPPLKDDRIILVKVDGTGRYSAVGVLCVSQGAKPGEKILYSRDNDGGVQAVLKMLGDGKINMNDAGNDKKAARNGDKVKVAIPAGTVIVSVTGDATGHPNPADIICEGTIVEGSESVFIGD